MKKGIKVVSATFVCTALAFTTNSNAFLTKKTKSTPTVETYIQKKEKSLDKFISSTKATTVFASLALAANMTKKHFDIWNPSGQSAWDKIVNTARKAERVSNMDQENVELILQSSDIAKTAMIAVSTIFGIRALFKLMNYYYYKTKTSNAKSLLNK